MRLLVLRSSTQIWAELHERAFRRLGGAVRVVVLDNLARGRAQAGHLRPDTQPALPRRARALRRRRAAVPRPRPRPQGQGGAGVGHAQKTPLKGMRFESLEQAQAYLDRWEERWADTRIHGTTKRQVAAMFAEEKPALGPLPLEPFRYYSYGERTVHLDGCVEVEAAYYGAPPGWIGREVQVQWDVLHVRILRPRRRASCCASTCAQQRGRHRIQDEDRPSKTHAEHAPKHAAAGPQGRPAHRHAVRADPPARRRDRACAASWACSRWPRSTAPRPSTRPAPRRPGDGRADLPLRPPLPRAPTRRRR